MPASEHLKDLKAAWGASCHSMWAELLSISMAELLVKTRYAEIGHSTPLIQTVFAPDVRGRLDTLTKDAYLGNVPRYKDAVITNRIIILSAAFELYLNSFVEAYLATRPKFFDAASSKRTKEGDKLYGETMKVRGLSARIKTFAGMVPFKIKSLAPSFSYIDDIYMLRNVLAHRAGLVDNYAATKFSHVTFAAGDRVRLSADLLLKLAAPVISVADSLDRRLTK